MPDQTFTYQPFERPIAIIAACGDCHGEYDCKCAKAGSKVALSGTEYDQKFPPVVTTPRTTVPLGAEGTNND